MTLRSSQWHGFSSPRSQIVRTSTINRLIVAVRTSILDLDVPPYEAFIEYDWSINRMSNPGRLVETCVT